LKYLASDAEQALIGHEGDGTDGISFVRITDQRSVAKALTECGSRWSA
jgi:hypothetical protein